MGHESYQKDSYNFSFGMIGGRKNNYNSPGHGKPSKPGKRPKKGKPSSNNSYDDDDNNNNRPEHSHPLPQQESSENINHSGQSQPPQQGQGVVLLPAPGAYACSYSTPYPYQCPPPQYPNQLPVGGYNGDYHVQGYPYPGPYVPHQGGYGGGHKNDVGLVGAAIGVASFGMFKLLRERRRYGGRY